MMGVLTLALGTAACTRQFTPAQPDSGAPDAATQDGQAPDAAPTTCGNNRVDPGEQCDLTDLAGNTCATLGYYPGQLACLQDCSDFDTSGCGGRCGDGVLQDAEPCDGTDLAGATCASLGYEPGGALACVDCVLETAGCCGDGVVGPAEACDDGDSGEWDGCEHCAIAEMLAPDDPAGAQNSPAVAATRSGDRIAIAWVEARLGTASRVRLRMFDGRGLPLGPAFEPVPVSMSGGAPDLAFGPDDVLWLVYQVEEERDGSGWGVYLRRFDRDGTPLTSGDHRVNVTTMDNQIWPHLSVSGSAEAAVVWQSRDPVAGENQVIFRRVDSSGIPLGVELRVAGDSALTSLGARVLLDDTGLALVTYLRSTGVYVRQVSATDSLGSALRVANPTDFPGTHGAASSTFLPSGEALLVWSYEDLSAPSPQEVLLFCRVLPAANVATIPTELVRRPAGASAANPDVVLSDVPGGTPVLWVGWTEALSGGVPQNMLQRFSPTGTVPGPVDTPQPVSTAVGFPHGRPDLTPMPAGAVVAVWRATDQDGDGAGVFFQRFDAQANPLGTLP